MTLLRLLFGTLCDDCGLRHRSDVCGSCFARRVARAERSDSRVIAHPEEDWSARQAEMERMRWPEKRKKTKLRAVR